MEEVLDKVLAEPIRPHFIIANVGGGFRLADVLKLVRNLAFLPSLAFIYLFNFDCLVLVSVMF